MIFSSQIIDEHTSDEELVALTLENQAVFSHIISRYKQKIFHYLRRVSGLPSEDVEDLLQEVFIKAYQNLNDFDADLKFSSWIYAVARNHAISQFRKRSVRPEGHFVLDSETEFAKLESFADLVEDVDADLMRQNVRYVLDNLDEKYREVLFLRYMEEKNYQEISDIIRKPMGTVASLLNGAKLQARKIITNSNRKFK